MLNKCLLLLLSNYYYYYYYYYSTTDMCFILILYIVSSTVSDSQGVPPRPIFQVSLMNQPFPFFQSPPRTTSIDYLFLCCWFFSFFGHTMQHVGSQFPDQGLNPRPLHWKHGVLITGSSGRSPIDFPLPSFFSPFPLNQQRI